MLSVLSWSEAQSILAARSEEMLDDTECLEGCVLSVQGRLPAEAAAMPVQSGRRFPSDPRLH